MDTPSRAAIFFTLLTAMLVAERLWPHRSDAPLHRLRWPANFGLALVNTLALAVVPLAAAGVAFQARLCGWGLLNLFQVPSWLALPLAWLALDAAIYAQHRAFHEIRALWPLHRVHHSDIAFDASTALRFHPGEILLSLLYKCGVALALGAPPLAVLWLEATVSGFALFNHANLRLPPRLEALLRRFIVTPDLHRIHHSVHRAETDSNYGSSLVLWDRLFRSHRAEPRDGHEAMRIGLDEFRDAQAQKLGALLRQPLR